MDRYSLLAHVASGLTTQFENLATESLLYLLRRYGTAHEAFVEVVSTTGYDPPRDLAFSTQVHMQHGSIPDLVGATTDGTGVLLVESKFWAPLTPNQPTGYLDRLPENGEGMVLFVVPEKRCDELWQQLVNRCRRKGIEPAEEAAETPNLRVARTPKGRLALVSWSFVLDRLEGRLEEARQDHGAHEVWQLKGLCRRLEEPFRPGAPGSEERKARLRSIVDEVGRRLSEAGLFDTKGYKAQPGPYYYRRFGTLAGHVNWSVGYNERYAARFEESLLWLRGHRRSVEDFGPSLAGVEHSFRCYELDGRLLFPLDVPEHAAREVAVQSLVAQVESIAELLRQRDISERGEPMGDGYMMTSETHPIYVDFVHEEHTKVPGRLGMTFAPGMKTPAQHGRWERDLESDLRVLREEYGADVLVSVLEEHEYGGYGIPELFERDLVGSLEVLRFAIEDMNVPKEAEAEEYEGLIRGIVDRMREGKSVIVHCRGGLGRTGTVAACVLVYLGDHSADEAIGVVRAARKGTVQTRDQEAFVRRFEETLRGREGGSS